MAERPHDPKRSRQDTARNVAMLALSALVVLFAVLNLGSVKVDWIAGSSKAPLIVVIAISLLIGIALSTLGNRVASKRRGRTPGRH
jgi:uncharacterized integral membrane protein